MEDKETYCEDLERRLSLLDAEIERLKSRIEALDLPSCDSEQCAQQLKQGYATRELLLEKQRELHRVGNERWKHLKEDIENIWNELKNSVKGSTIKS